MKFKIIFNFLKNIFPNINKSQLKIIPLVFIIIHLYISIIIIRPNNTDLSFHNILGASVPGFFITLIILILILLWIEYDIYITSFIYFYFKRLINMVFFKKIVKKIVKSLYSGLLTIYLSIIIIYFIFLFLINDFDYTLILKSLNGKYSLILFSIITLGLILLKYIYYTYNFFYNNIIKIRFLLLLLIINTLIGKYNNFIITGIKDYIIVSISTTSTILLFLIFFKFINEIIKKDNKKLYYTNAYKKIYYNIENKLKLSLEKKELDIKDFNKQFFKLFREKTIKNYEVGNYITTINDEPINIGEDIFGFKDISKNLYDLILRLDTSKLKGSYSIGVVGEWGIGKSGILNLLEQEYIDGNGNFILYKFNPWNFEKNELINHFFSDLSKEISKETGKSYISTLIPKYINAISGINTYIDIFGKLLSLFTGEKTLEEIKTSISKELEHLEKKIIIFIDDLDRCEPAEVLIMLNLIKNIGNFKNIIYIVSYDKKNIVKVLEEKGFDKDYLDKIINLEKYVLNPGKSELKVFFKSSFNEILKKVNFEEIKIIEIIEHLLKEFDELFEKENFRFIKKLINQLNITILSKYGKDEDNFNELLKDNEDFYNLVLFNYIRLKDYKWFNEVVTLKNNISKNNISYMSEPNFYKNIDNRYLFRKFLRNFLGFAIEYIESKNKYQLDNLEIIRDGSSYNNNQVIKFKNNRILLKEFL